MNCNVDNNNFNPCYQEISKYQAFLAGADSADMLVEVLSHLSDQNQQVVCTVNKSWKNITLRAAQKGQLLRLNKLLDQVIPTINLQQYREQINALNALKQGKEIFATKTLSQLGQCLQKIYKELLPLHKIIHLNGLNILADDIDKSTLPKGFTKFFSHLQIKQELAQANQIDGLDAKESALLEISKKAIRCGLVKKALKIADSLSDSANFNREKAFQDIAYTIFVDYVQHCNGNKRGKRLLDLIPPSFTTVDSIDESADAAIDKVLGIIFRNETSIIEQALGFRRIAFELRTLDRELALVIINKFPCAHIRHNMLAEFLRSHPAN